MDNENKSVDKEEIEALPEYDTVRQEKEAIFHDNWAKSIDIDSISVGSFDSPTSAENRYILNLFGSLKGKRILDLGCGMGDATLYFASRGATVYAIDISHGMIDVTRRLAEKHGLSQLVVAQQMSAEKLDFQDGFFDFVYGNGVLHHVDYLTAVGEVNRILKKGGRAVFIEPLSYNPVIWLYRIIADTVRTEDEHPLSKQNIQTILDGHNAQSEQKCLWSEANHKEFHLLTLLIMVWFFVGQWINPRKVRYWKRFIEMGYQYEKAFNTLYAMDQSLFRILPFMRWLCWNAVINLKKAQ